MKNKTNLETLEETKTIVDRSFIRPTPTFSKICTRDGFAVIKDDKDEGED